MVDFNDINYRRVDFEDTKKEISSLILLLDSANDYNSFIKITKDIIRIQSHIEEMSDYADIKNMRDSKDDFYRRELEYWNEFKPKFDLLFLPFYDIIFNSKYKSELGEVIPDNFFNTIKAKSKISSLDIVDLQQKENKLKTRYRELNTNLIMFDGEEKPLSYVSSFYSSCDRSIRKKAHDAVNDYYLAHQKEYDEVLLDLVNTRNSIAKEVGLKDYSEYSLYNLRRFGYDYKDIKQFRDNITEYIVPLCRKLDEWKKKELNLENLEYYDSIFYSSMPEVLYNNEDFLIHIKDSFKDVDSELYNLYCEMLDKNYIDLLQRENKLNIGITNYLTESCMPTVTGNLKGTYYDVDVTTHEVGHAFQKYCASKMDKKYIVPALLKYPTFEIAEMFSYAMELIMMDHVGNLFNEEDNKKYGFIKIYNLVSTLPYICLVDEFQELIYRKENLTSSEARNIWLTLTTKYGLERSNKGHKNLDDGGYFYRQSHIFLNPFYYIDYALSYFGAFSIWDKCSTNLEFFKDIGSVASYYSLNSLIEKYNLKNPFSKEEVESISKKLEYELERRKVVEK